MERLHRWLVNYIPLIGYATYCILSGFDDELFLPLLLTGWIVMVVYQTIISAIYQRPKFLLLSVLSLLATPVLLLLNAHLKKSDFSIIFIETAAIGMMAIIIALITSFLVKGIKEGMPAEVRFPVFFSIALFGTAGFFLAKLFWRFFAAHEFDWLNILLVCAGIAGSTFYIIKRMHEATNGFTGTIVHPKGKELPVSGILFTLLAWLVLVPLAMWIVQLTR